MQAVVCPHCRKEFEITQALRDQVAERVIQEEREKNNKLILQVRLEEKEKTEKRLRDEMNLKFSDIANEAEEVKQKNKQLNEQVLAVSKQLRMEKEKENEREIENEKKLLEISEQARAEAFKKAEEVSKDKLLQLTKQLDDTKKLLEDAQRKSNQVSQQLQGEVVELELEIFLQKMFPDDEIIPVKKGQFGADIKQVVKSPKGYSCGVILWESKKTKDWKDDWLHTLKNNEVTEKAMFSVIVSAKLPKEILTGMGTKNGIYICSFDCIYILAELLRRNLLDVARQKAINSFRTDNANLLYTYITSHEFQQQIEQQVTVYGDMLKQIKKERIAYERFWAERESQIHKVFLATATICGTIQGKVGASMPHIKGLELLEIDGGDGTHRE